MGKVAWTDACRFVFPISRDPPEGGTKAMQIGSNVKPSSFPISRDPPEGGTKGGTLYALGTKKFPISRDPPEGGT